MNCRSRSITCYVCVCLLGIFVVACQWNRTFQSHSCQGYTYLNCEDWEWRAVVITSPDVLTDARLRGIEKGAVFFVPSYADLSIVEALLERRIAELVEQLDGLPPQEIDPGWEGALNELRSTWARYVRSYVGYKIDNERYVYVHMIHPDHIEMLDMNFHRDIWKSSLLKVMSSEEVTSWYFGNTVNLKKMQISGRIAEIAGNIASERGHPPQVPVKTQELP